MEMQEFTLGEVQPRVQNIRVHAGSGAGAAGNANAVEGATPAEAEPVEGSELFLEFEVEWRSQQASWATPPALMADLGCGACWPPSHCSPLCCAP